MIGKRLEKEFQYLKKCNPIDLINTNFAISVDEESIDGYSRWTVTIEPHYSTPYARGKFDFEFFFNPGEYPMKAPDVTCKTKIYHPNIHPESGRIKDILGLTSQWKPMLNAKHLIIYLNALLVDPDSEIPYDADICKQFKNNREEFNKTARKWTKDHARPSSLLENMYWENLNKAIDIGLDPELIDSMTPEMLEELLQDEEALSAQITKQFDTPMVKQQEEDTFAQILQTIQEVQDPSTKGMMLVELDENDAARLPDDLLAIRLAYMDDLI